MRLIAIPWKCGLLAVPYAGTVYMDPLMLRDTYNAYN